MRKKQKVITIDLIRDRIELLRGLTSEQLKTISDAKDIFSHFCTYLNSGEVRAAEKDIEGKWRVNAWVKEGILIGMRLGITTSVSVTRETLSFFDKDTLPLQDIDGVKRNIRIVPGGTSVRNGCFIGENVVCMPPSYINIGAYVGRGTMIDSHATVGSCAQVGERCHISAGAQIGGVLEPVNATPCIVEDNALMGINTSIAEGVIVQKNAILGSGVNITSSTPVYDLVKKIIYRASTTNPLIIPRSAVVVPGNRAVLGNAFGKKHGLQIATPIIPKYRDDKTDAKTALEVALR